MTLQLLTFIPSACAGSL